MAQLQEKGCANFTSLGWGDEMRVGLIGQTLSSLGSERLQG